MRENGEEAWRGCKSDQTAVQVWTQMDYRGREGSLGESILVSSAVLRESANTVVERLSLSHPSEESYIF